MGEVTVTVNGRPYRMACEDGQETHLRSLADDLADRVADLAGQVGQVGDAQLLVMAALITADEARALANGEGEERTAEMKAELTAAQAAERTLKAELQSARAAVEAGRAAAAKREAAGKADLSAAADSVQHERDALKAELESLRSEMDAMRQERSAHAAAEASAAEAVEALYGRVAKLAAALQAH